MDKQPTRTNKPRRKNNFRKAPTRRPVNGLKTFEKQKELQDRIARAVVATTRQSTKVVSTPLYKYIAGLIDFDHNARSQLTPLSCGKLHLKTVRINKTIGVSSTGNLKISIAPKYVAMYDNTSTANNFKYDNSAAYDPTIVTGGGTSVAITELAAACNLDELIMPKVRVQSLHIKFSLTGMSNLNKKGTIHLMESTSADYYNNSDYATELNIPYGPVSEVYKGIEIANMTGNSDIQYNYFPMSTADLNNDFTSVDVETTSTGTVHAPFKLFGFIINGADTSTQVRMEIEATLECEVVPAYINTYPIAYSTCFIDSNPTVNLLNQYHDLRISTGTLATNKIQSAVMRIGNENKMMLNSTFQNNNNRSKRGIESFFGDEDTFIAIS
jgi:hypothetical protein